MASNIENISRLLKKLENIDELESLRKTPSLLKNASYRAFKINQLRKLQVKFLEEDIKRDVMINGV